MTWSETKLTNLNKDVVLLRRQVKNLDDKISQLVEKINARAVDYTKASLFLGKIFLFILLQ